MALAKKYYDSGVLKAEGIMQNGLKEGKWIYYFESGIKHREINFNNDVENGEWKMWHENGNLYLEQNKIHGRSDGYWKEYYESGELKEIGEYKNGEYFPIDFWDEGGNQLLKNGTGTKIEKFGHLELDIYKQYYKESKFIKEVKISSAQYGKFNSSD
ncbi:hypothetical protein [Agriterribacter sp.]|uniref:toxin-antitoxin system YwqK family antitoxin n=1 Tax=Agriterribacter sp. TaxID=2821509 RepID=UPI002B8CE8EF|nr:hypothetical protein [Agriterribacter sp.]HTN08282.1 hypothetical protein [Agriterribacter sp.]